MLYLFRNTGLSTSISNPSNQSQPIPDLQKNFVDEPKTSETETIKHSSSSIIGLRAAAFEAGKSKSEDTDELNKPRPPPKPRPWSIVGVDRKSGEYTQLESSATAEGSISAEKEENTSGPGAISSVRDRIASLNKPDSPGSASSVAPTNIRDRIANMNKNSELEVNKRKGNSLPRSTEPVSKSPGTRPKNSPNNRKKDSTSDDPRILKLDDDFMYDDTVNVWIFESLQIPNFLQRWILNLCETMWNYGKLQISERQQALVLIIMNYESTRSRGGGGWHD